MKLSRFSAVASNPRNSAEIRFQWSESIKLEKIKSRRRGRVQRQMTSIVSNIKSDVTWQPRSWRYSVPPGSEGLGFHAIFRDNCCFASQRHLREWLRINTACKTDDGSYARRSKEASQGNKIILLHFAVQFMSTISYGWRNSKPCSTFCRFQISRKLHKNFL